MCVGMYVCIYKVSKPVSNCASDVPHYLEFIAYHHCLGQPYSVYKGIKKQQINIHIPGGSAGKEPTCNEGDLGRIPGLGRCPGEGNGYPFQYSGLENSMDYTVRGVTKSQTQLSDFHSFPLLTT